MKFKNISINGQSFGDGDVDIERMGYFTENEMEEMPVV